MAFLHAYLGRLKKLLPSPAQLETHEEQLQLLLMHLARKCVCCWFEVAPSLFEDTYPSPTPAYLEAWAADAHYGAQPWQDGGPARRQQA
jgi:hypothetical protein